MKHAAALVLLCAAIAGPFEIGPGMAQSAQAPTSFEIVPNLPHPVRASAFSRNGALLATGGFDGGTRLWDFASGRLLRVFPGHAKDVKAVQFSADGERLITAGKDKTARFWEVRTGRLISTTRFQSNAEEFSNITLSPDGTRALTGQLAAPVDKSAKLWDLATGKLLRTFSGDAGTIWSVAFSPDGRRVLAGGDGVRLWDADSGRLLRTFPGASGTVWSVLFSPDGARALAGDGKVARQWDASTGRLLNTFSGQTGGIWSLSFSPDGRKVVTGDNEKSAKLWDSTTGELLRSFTLDQGRIQSIAFTPDGKQLLLVSDSSDDIALWDPASGNRLRKFGSLQLVLGHPAFSLDGKAILAGGHSLSLWDASTAQLLNSWASPVTGMDTAAVSSDGEHALWRSGPKTLQLSDGTKGHFQPTFEGHANWLEDAAFSNDGTRLLTSSSDKTVKLWEATSGRLLRTSTHASEVNSLAFSPDGTRFVTADFEANLSHVMKLWDTATGQLVRTFTGQNFIYGLTFSPDGTQILMGESPGQLKLWDAATGRLLRTFTGHTDFIYFGSSGLAFSPDGARVLSASADKTVKLWETSTGRLLHSFPLNVVSVAFSPDGNRALLGSEVWDLNKAEVLLKIFPSPNDQWLAITPEGFFVASEKGAGILNAVRGLDVYSIDQFYQSLYRPDLVREKLAGDPRGLVREAAAKLDLGKVMASGSAPDVRLTLPARALGSADNQVIAEAEITDRGGGIGRVEWRVNGVTSGVDNPVPGAAGQPLRLTRNLALDRGDNIIEVVAYNAANLIASVPSSVGVAAAQPTAPASAPGAAPAPSPSPLPVAVAQPRLFALVAGVNDYADKRIALSYAVSDAREVARGFKEAANGLYQSVEIKLMTDAELTRDRLDAAFAEIAAKAQASDVFVLYLAGHGKTVDGRYYFIPQDFFVDGELTDKAVNAAVIARAVSQDQLQRWFASVPARKSVILFDTCDSGTLTGDAGETQQFERGAANDRLAQATGRSIITASGGSQEALEGYRGHGLFTYEILDALNRADGDGSGTIEVTELAAYVFAEVTELSQKVFKQRQAPQMKITANYPLAKQIRVLQDEVAPVAQAGPAYQLAQTAQLQIKPASGATVVRSLSAKTAVTVLRSEGGWSLIASEGKPLGYVATRDLMPIQ